MEWIVGSGVAAIVVTAGWWLSKYVRSVLRGDYRHPQDMKQTWWTPGGGTHGGAGGQVPPLIPDRDPEDEIR